MSSQYKKNSFSAENLSVPHTSSKNNIDKVVKPNIDNLIKRILTERRRVRKNSMVLGFGILLTILIFIFFQNKI